MHDVTGFLGALALLAPALPSASAGAPPGEAFLRANDPQTGRLTSLRRAEDTNRVEFIRPGQALGAVMLRVRASGCAVARSQAEHEWRGADVRIPFARRRACAGRSA